ncbi:acyltransferase family protein [Methanobrevibacter sp.]|uniref:acyltransferase family protein n=1 Tax=Methanobrevibacter sp. TaxID=66852 RepID=UPI0025F5DB0C|nr:acyltransferase family protein [Methanobrevibacter sp.]MBQ2831205.1 acyltransferase family protein [Methanobrevibacter sp.]
MSNVKARINKYDNLKGLAIFFIVLWHLDVVRSVNPVMYKFIYFASLPVFFFVSGYFSKIGPDQPLKSFRRLIIPYIIFTIITTLYCHFFMGDPLIPKNMFLTGTSILWFLVALFFMKMMLPIVDKFRYPLIISIIAALLIGFINMENNILGIVRGVGCFPLFLLGFYYNDYKHKLETEYGRYVELFKKHSKLISILAILFMLVIAFTITDARFYLFRVGYKGNLLYEMIKRVLILICEFLAVLLLNRYMTNSKNLLTTFGINSMAVYVLHYYVRLIIKPTVMKVFGHSSWVYFPIVLVLAFIVTFVLSRDIVTKYFNKFTDSFYYLLVRRSET